MAALKNANGPIRRKVRNRNIDCALYTKTKRRHTHSPVGRREQAVTRNMQYNQHRREIVSPPKREARNVVPDPSATREAKTQPMHTPRSFARREYQNRLILNIWLCCIYSKTTCCRQPAGIPLRVDPGTTAHLAGIAQSGAHSDCTATQPSLPWRDQQSPRRGRRAGRDVGVRLAKKQTAGPSRTGEISQGCEETSHMTSRDTGSGSCPNHGQTNSNRLSYTENFAVSRRSSARAEVGGPRRVCAWGRKSKPPDPLAQV